MRVVFRGSPCSRSSTCTPAEGRWRLAVRRGTGKFWRITTSAVRGAEAARRRDLKEAAGRLELDQEAFGWCIDSSRFAERVAEDVSAGSEAGVNGTPAMFINGRFLNGAQPYDAIAQVIDQELRRSGGAD
ncbi:MAG: DsbA family protein [Thermoanaerobaculia bacterium]